MIRRIADCANVSAPAVRHWIGGIRSVTEPVAPAIEAATRGAVTCEELCPDVQWTRDEAGRVIGYHRRLIDPVTQDQQRETANAA